MSKFELSFALRQYGTAFERITAIPNPSATTLRRVSLPRKKEVLYVGTWDPNKGINEMVKVVPGFLHHHPEWSFHIVGVGNPDVVRSALPEEVISRIQVEGVIRDRSEVEDRMASASLLLLPSYFESYGLVIAEAILQGAIPVVTRVGLGYELSDGVSGFVFDPMSPTALRDALERAVAAEAEWPAIASEGFKLVSDRTWEGAGQQMDELLRRVCEEGMG